MKQVKPIIYVSITTAMILWSFSFIWFKQANEIFPPFSIVFLRLLISSIILVSITLFSGYFRMVSKSDLGWFILLAFFNPFLYFIGESLGLTKVSSTTGAVIISLIPVLVPFAAWTAFKEKLSILNYTGIITSLVGVLLIVLNKNLNFAASPDGIGFMFMAVCSAVIYTILLKHISGKYHPLYIITFQNLFGAILFLPLFIYFEWDVFTKLEISIMNLRPIILLAVFASSLAFILYSYAIRELGASKTSIFSNIIPVCTAVLAFIILKETLSLQKVLGIAIVVLGLFLSQARSSFL